MSNYLENYKCKQIKDFLDGKIQKICIMGGTGRGKTYALQWIYHMLMLKHVRKNVYGMPITPLLFTLSEYLDDMKFHMENFKGDPYLTQKYFTTRPLLLDEVGIESHSEKNLPYIHRLFDSNQRDFVFVTNLNREDLAKRYDDRIWSRMKQDCLFLSFGGDDWRERNVKIEVAKF
jgi:DNA replication protein DnaC